MSFDDLLEEYLNQRDRNNEKIEYLKKQIDTETERNNLLIDLLSLNNGNDLITDSFFSLKNSDSKNHSHTADIDYLENKKYYIIDSFLTVITLGEVHEEPYSLDSVYSFGGKVSIGRQLSPRIYGRIPGLFYPIGYSSIRLYPSYNGCNLRKSIVAYKCEIKQMYSSEDILFVIKCEDGLCLKGRDGWHTFLSLFDHELEFKTVEGFFGLTNNDVINLIKTKMAS